MNDPDSRPALLDDAIIRYNRSLLFFRRKQRLVRKEGDFLLGHYKKKPLILDSETRCKHIACLGDKHKTLRFYKKSILQKIENNEPFTVINNLVKLDDKFIHKVRQHARHYNYSFRIEIYDDIHENINDIHLLDKECSFLFNIGHNRIVSSLLINSLKNSLKEADQWLQQKLRLFIIGKVIHSFNAELCSLLNKIMTSLLYYIDTKENSVGVLDEYSRLAGTNIYFKEENNESLLGHLLAKKIMVSKNKTINERYILENDFIILKEKCYTLTHV